MKSTCKELVFGLLAVLAVGCAKQSAPTGGPKDVDPPVPLRSSPVNYSTNFKGKKFIVEFDEYINLLNVNQELFVSPPVENKPKVVMRGKKMVVRINNELQDSTTYNFNFFNSITDLNEGNVLENFQFEFSTGDTFDSTYVGGILTDAYTGDPLDGVYVMLYRNLDDSTPRTQAPECVGKTNADGYFIVPNMKAGVPYYMFALKDLNNNRKFDQPTESVAFCDSTFMPSFKPCQMYDTLRILESISRDRKDTVYRDSIYSYTMMVSTVDDVKLNMFTEESHIQYLRDVYRFDQRRLAIAFNDLLDTAFSICPIIDTTFSDNWCKFEGSFPSDSVVFWITDSALYKRDTLLMQVSYTMQDSANADYLQTDTLEFISRVKASAPKKEERKIGGFISKLAKGTRKDDAEKEEKPKVSDLKVTHNIQSAFDLIDPIVLTASYPIDTFRASSIKLMKIDDNGQGGSVDFTLSKSETDDRNYMIDFKRGENQKFELTVPAGAMTDIYGNINDSVKQTFNIQANDFYGSVIMNISGVSSQGIVQLMDAKNKLLQEIRINADTTLNIGYLKPGKYSFRLFYDNNGNGVWDTGNFRERRQPERMFYFRGEIEAKSGWDIEYGWSLE